MIFSCLMTANQRIKCYICNIIIYQQTNKTMFGTIRNIIAFLATFTVIMTTAMIALQFLFAIYNGNTMMTSNQEVVAFVVGVILAIVLIPYYHYPC